VSLPLVAHGVTVTVDNKAIVSAITTSVAPGDLVAVVGPNGAGKTTLLRVLAGVLPASHGSVRCFDLDPATADRRHLARRLSYVPQRYELAFPFAVEDVVAMGRYPHRRGPWLETADDRKHIQQALEQFRLTDVRSRRFDQLSGGEQRRVLLAQVCCQEADCILLDEPTAALDPAAAQELFVWLRELTGRQRSVVVVTHDLNLALRHATILWVLQGGELSHCGSPRDEAATAALERAFAVSLHVGVLPGGDRFVVPR
jgi:iron complex transport system ATP-binding protein